MLTYSDCEALVHESYYRHYAEKSARAMAWLRAPNVMESVHRLLDAEIQKALEAAVVRAVEAGTPLVTTRISLETIAARAWTKSPQLQGRLSAADIREALRIVAMQAGHEIDGVDLVIQIEIPGEEVEPGAPDPAPMEEGALPGPQDVPEDPKTPAVEAAG